MRTSSVTTRTWLSEDTSEHPQSNSCNRAAYLCGVVPPSLSTSLSSLSVSAVHTCQASLSEPLSKDMCDPFCPSPKHTLVTVEASYKHYLPIHLSTMDCQHDNKQTNKNLRCGNRKGLLSRNDQTHHRMGPKTMESIPPSKRNTQADIQLRTRQIVAPANKSPAGD